MRGSPLLHLLLLLIGLALTGAAVWHVTGNREKAPETTVHQAVASKETLHDLTLSSTVPVTVEVSYVGKVIARTEGPTTDFATQVALPTEGGDLVISAKWEPSDVRAAVRVQVSADGNSLADKTFWGEGSVEDVCTVERSTP
jgi:hypothetical protein